MSNLPFPQDADHLKVREIALNLRVDVKTVRRWIKDQRLPATRAGRDWRILRSDLKAFLLREGGGALAHGL